MYILGTIETPRATWSDSVVAESLNGLLLESFVGIEVIEIERAEVRHGSAIGEF